MNTASWWVADSSGNHGDPVDVAAVAEMIFKGLLRDDSLVYPCGGTDWIPANQDPIIGKMLHKINVSRNVTLSAVSSEDDEALPRALMEGGADGVKDIAPEAFELAPKILILLPIAGLSIVCTGLYYIGGLPLIFIAIAALVALAYNRLAAHRGTTIAVGSILGLAVLAFVVDESGILSEALIFGAILICAYAVGRAYRNKPQDLANQVRNNEAKYGRM